MLTVLGFLSCMLLFGQQEWILKGRVMAAGKPVNGATVSVLQTGLGAVTDTAGYFNIAVPQKEIFILKISAVGYTTATQQIKMHTTGDCGNRHHERSKPYAKPCAGGSDYTQTFSKKPNPQLV